MAVGDLTYTSIASTTLSSTSTALTFNSFSGYTDLLITVHTLNPANANLVMRFNGDSTVNAYQMSGVYGNVTTLENVSYDFTGVYINMSNGHQSTSVPGYMEIHVPLYSNTSAFHTGIVKFGSMFTGSSATGAQVDISNYCWRNTSAITSIEINNQGNNFAIGTVASLYGITAA